jgi:hypothetical protein
MRLPSLEDVRWRFGRGQFVLLGVAASVAIAYLAYAAPLTYDEAFNRLHYGPMGARKILHTYDLPNNHVPFTILQTLIPSGLLDWNPWTIRIFGVACGIGLIATALGVARWRRSSPLIPLFVIAGSPLLVTYLFLARGYGFSSLLLLLAVLTPVVYTQRGALAGPCLGALFLALAAWPIPTNLFVAPGWFAAVVFFWGVPTAAASAVVFVLTAAATLGPIESQIVDRSSNNISEYHDWATFFGHTLSATSRVPALLALAVIVVAARAAWTSRTNLVSALRAAEPDTQLTVLGWSMCISWFGMVGITRLAGLQLPFTRSAVPSLWVGAIGVIAMIPRGRLENLVAALLAPACILGILVWTNAVRHGDWARVAETSHTPVLYGTTPVTIRDLASIHADRVACSYRDLWVCALAATYLERDHITSDQRIGVAYDGRLPCAIGSKRAPRPWEVNVYRRGKLLGVLCH